MAGLGDEDDSLEAKLNQLAEQNVMEEEAMLDSVEVSFSNRCWVQPPKKGVFFPLHAQPTGSRKKNYGQPGPVGSGHLMLLYPKAPLEFAADDDVCVCVFEPATWWAVAVPVVVHRVRFRSHLLLSRRISTKRRHTAWWVGPFYATVGAHPQLLSSMTAPEMFSRCS
jgi:hypothetical protein